MHDTTFEQITENLKRALDIVENCGEAYKNASDTIKKLMNQAIFEKFYISNDADMEFKVDAEFKPPFDQILEPVKDDIIRINRLAQDCSSKLSYYIDIAKDHIQKIFGCGLYTINNSTNMSTCSNGSNFFSHNSSSKVLLVELRGIEPLSEDPFIQASPITVYVLTFPLTYAHKQAYAISSFISLLQSQSFDNRVSHISRCQSLSCEQLKADTLQLRQRLRSFLRLRLYLVSGLIRSSGVCGWLPKLQNPRRNQYNP